MASTNGSVPIPGVQTIHLNPLCTISPWQIQERLARILCGGIRRGFRRGRRRNSRSAEGVRCPRREINLGGGSRRFGGVGDPILGITERQPQPTALRSQPRGSPTLLRSFLRRVCSVCYTASGSTSSGICLAGDVRLHLHLRVHNHVDRIPSGASDPWGRNALELGRLSDSRPARPAIIASHDGRPFAARRSHLLAQPGRE